MIYMLFPLKFRDSKKTRDGRTTDRPRTDRPSYRDAWTHLKTTTENDETFVREDTTVFTKLFTKLHCNKR